ncbi:MAG TPA: hypothetical protein VFH49_09115, partial [Aquabacterium sp.]|nr:hypothetical protein [Aquabacterium sp.]
AVDLTMPGRSDFAPAADDKEAAFLTDMPQALKASGLTISLGAIWWATRASGLVTSLILTTPAWRTLDPLPVLFSQDPDNDAEPSGESDHESDTAARAEQLFDEHVDQARDPALIG